MRPVRPWSLEPTLRFLATLPLVLAVCGLGTEVAARAIGAGPNDRPTWLLVAGTGILHLATLALLIPLLRAHTFSWRDAFGLFDHGWLRRWAVAAALTIPALAAAWLLHRGATAVLEHFTLPHDNQAAVDAVRLADRWWERGFLFGFAALTAPLVEEILFRGILWPIARDLGWPRLGAAGVGLLFAIIHFNLAALVPLWLLGVFWVWLYERSGDLTSPILSHALFNATNFVWILVASPAPPP